MRNWYLLYTKPKQEVVAVENLSRQGFEVYLPRIRQRRRRRERMIDAVVPMFPRYLFIRLDDQTDNWKPIRSTVGVARIVTFGDWPATVPEALIAALRSAESPDGVHEPAHRRFRPGEKVRIVEGALAGYEGIFELQSGPERVSVLLEVLGGPVSVRLAERDVQPL